MAKIIDTPMPYVRFGETAPGGVPTPSAGQQQLFVDPADHYPKLKDSAGAVVRVGFVPVVVILECNTSLVVGSDVTFDTYYDRSQSDLSGVLPAELGLSSADGVTFEADEDLILAVDVYIAPHGAPGHTGRIEISSPTYDSGPFLALLASGNPSDFFMTRTIPMSAGDTLALTTSGTGTDILADYATMQIVRIA